MPFNTYSQAEDIRTEADRAIANEMFANAVAHLRLGAEYQQGADNLYIEGIVNVCHNTFDDKLYQERQYFTYSAEKHFDRAERLFNDAHDLELGRRITRLLVDIAEVK
jgi:hypothetical protein